MRDKLYYAFFKNRLEKPISVIVFVTSKCNSRCRHCFNWRNLNTNNPDLALEDIEKFSRALGRLMDLGLSGGEPFLRDDLNKVVQIFIDNNNPRNLAIPTNGQLPDRVADMTEELISRNPRTFFSLSLSLDGPARIHDEIRGLAGSFERLRNTYTRLTRLKGKYKNISLKADTTLCHNNIGQLNNLITLVKEEFPLVDFHNFEIMRGEPADQDLTPPSLEELREALPHIYKAWSQSSYYGKNSRLKSFLARKIKMFIFKTYLDILESEEQVIPCFADKFSCVLWANGDISFCELLPAIGNIKKDDFDKIWFGEKARVERQKIREGGCYCVHSCFQNKNIMFNPRLYGSMIKFFLKG